eukprot:jgi/Botrbrau1/5185/Bobra.0172s0055.1
MDLPTRPRTSHGSGSSGLTQAEQLWRPLTSRSWRRASQPVVMFENHLYREPQWGDGSSPVIELAQDAAAFHDPHMNAGMYMPGHASPDEIWSEDHMDHMNNWVSNVLGLPPPHHPPGIYTRRPQTADTASLNRQYSGEEFSPLKPNTPLSPPISAYFPQAGVLPGAGDPAGGWTPYGPRPHSAGRGTRNHPLFDSARLPDQGIGRPPSRGYRPPSAGPLIPAAALGFAVPTSGEGGEYRPPSGGPAMRRPPSPMLRRSCSGALPEEPGNAAHIPSWPAPPAAVRLSATGLQGSALPNQASFDSVPNKDQLADKPAEALPLFLHATTEPNSTKNDALPTKETRTVVGDQTADADADVDADVDTTPRPVHTFPVEGSTQTDAPSFQPATPSPAAQDTVPQAVSSPVIAGTSAETFAQQVAGPMPKNISQDQAAVPFPVSGSLVPDLEPCAEEGAESKLEDTDSEDPAPVFCTADDLKGAVVQPVTASAVVQPAASGSGDLSDLQAFGTCAEPPASSDDPAASNSQDASTGSTLHAAEPCEPCALDVPGLAAGIQTLANREGPGPASVSPRPAGHPGLNPGVSGDLPVTLGTVRQLAQQLEARKPTNSAKPTPPSLPLIALEICHDRGAVPDNRSPVPDNRSAVRDNRSAVPDNRSVVPDNASAVHNNRSSVPDDRSAVPDSSSAVPDNRSAVSNSCSAVPDEASLEQAPSVAASADGEDASAPSQLDDETGADQQAPAGHFGGDEQADSEERGADNQGERASLCNTTEECGPQGPETDPPRATRALCRSSSSMNVPAAPIAPLVGEDEDVAVKKDSEAGVCSCDDPRPRLRFGDPRRPSLSTRPAVSEAMAVIRESEVATERDNDDLGQGRDHPSSTSAPEHVALASEAGYPGVPVRGTKGSASNNPKLGSQMEICPADESEDADEQNPMKRGLKSVYDPQLESPTSSGRDKRRDPALRLAVEMPVDSVMDISSRSFIWQPGPASAAVQCYIIRDRRFGKMFPRYSLFMESGQRFLLAARKRKKTTSSHYVISHDEQDISRNSDNYCGKVKSNFMGTEFVALDNGSKPGSLTSGSHLRTELAAVTYEYNLLGTKGPRRMTLALPKVDAAGRRCVFRPDDGKGGLLEHQKRREGMERIDILRNKAPKWSEKLGAYCLNFNGRVTHASVKNFQLISPSDPETTLMQFGKVGKDLFTLDYRAPLSAIQAFAISLTSFDNKLACE